MMAEACDTLSHHQLHVDGAGVLLNLCTRTCQSARAQTPTGGSTRG